MSGSGFVFEAEGGLAFPAVATGKVGVGLQRFAGGPSGTIGLRLWPLHAYYQQSIPTKDVSVHFRNVPNGGFNAGAKTAPIFTAAIGISRWKQEPIAERALTPKQSFLWGAGCFSTDIRPFIAPAT